MSFDLLPITAGAIVRDAGLPDTARPWLLGQLAQAKRRQGSAWPEHERWVREYLTQEAGDRAAVPEVAS